MVCSASNRGALVTMIIANPALLQRSRKANNPGKGVILVEIFLYSSSFDFHKAVCSSLSLSGKSFSTIINNINPRTCGKENEGEQPSHRGADVDVTVW